jgi:FG-GAP-like repeat/Bacterial Ig-like domain (group 3)
MSRSTVCPVVRRILSSSIRAAATMACVAAIFALPGTVLAQGLLQPPSVNVGTGTKPVAVAAADFARSGFQSMAVADSTNKNFKVYLATGPATFAGAVTYSACNGVPTNTGPTGILAADVNNDGYPDLLVACSGTIDLFLNAGNGTFNQSTTFTATSPSAMVVGNFSNNSVADLAVARSGGITVFTNVGGANGTINITIAGVGTLTGIVTGDFNHDGNLDLAVSDSTNSKVDVLTGNGTGNFTLLGGYSTGAGTKPSGLVAADFNNDGNLDVATSNPGKNTATILLGSSTGALTAQTAQATGTNPIGISVADINSDGLPDLVVFDSPTASTGEVDVLLGNGDGTLQTAQAASQTFVPGTLAAVADFNRNGKPDIALTQQNTNLVSLMLNNTLPTAYPDGRSYSGARALTNGYGNMADAVATGDFNKDGLLDIAVTYLEDNVVRVLTNNGNGFNSATAYAVGSQPYDVVSADLNGDGYPDLVTANTNPNSATGSVSVLLNNGKGGNGTFAAAANYTVGKDPYQVAVGDINGDGYPDLAVANYGSNTVSILMGSKTGTFTVSATTLATCTNPYGVAIGDFKHNGFPSIAVTCAASGQMEVFPNNGNGTFGTPNIYTTDARPGPLVVGDFNRDGKLDIVTGNTTANDVSFFAGHGDNTFANGVISPSLNFPAIIAAGDVNGDGILDIVGTAPNYNAVIVTLGKGDGTFGTIQQRAAGQFSATKQPWGLALGDFLNDGQLDIVTADTYNQINIAQPAYQQRYIAEYPAIPAGNPSIDVLTNDSAASISLSVAPPNNTLPLPDNNTNVVIQSTVQPAQSGNTPTGSVIFENAAGSPLGTGPYTLNGSGVAAYNVGHLGSGSYLFTSLYSGDSNYQPTTASGASFAVTVNGTPISLTLNGSSVSASVPYGSSVAAATTVTGTAGKGVPTGTATVLTSSGTNIETITLAAAGNNSTGTKNFTAVNPLNVGTYNVYAQYNPTNGNYLQGTSSYVVLTVTAAPTTTAIACNYAFLSIDCTATVTNTATGGAVGAGFTVDFSVNGGGQNARTTNGAGQANYTLGEFFGSFQVTAAFPAQGNYQASSAQTTVLCFIICGLDRRGQTIALTPFAGLQQQSAAQSGGAGGSMPLPFRSY